MSTQSDWMHDIATACDELGYGIRKLEPGRIELLPIRGTHGPVVIIETVFLTGTELRALLVPIGHVEPSGIVVSQEAFDQMSQVPR